MRGQKRGLPAFREKQWAEQQLRAILGINKVGEVRQLVAYKLAEILARGDHAAQTEAVKWLRECLRINAETKTHLDSTKEFADQLLAKIERFGIGKTVPKLEGEDLDGRSLNLSDYRGKVVLLDFWGYWCVPCVRLIPHASDLVDRHKERPFVLLGVNSDTGAAELQKRLRESPVTWRSFKNKQSLGKSVGVNWMISAWPTLILIDQDGIILKRWEGTPIQEELDREIEKAIQAVTLKK